MALTKIQPSGINTSAEFTFANANITSNLVVGSKSNLGPASNVIITGGTNGYVLSTDGAGNLSWVAQSGGAGVANISNGTSNVSIATSGGNVTTSVAGNANILVVTGTGANVAGTANVTGNIVGGGELNISGNAVVGGNLTVDGDLIYVNVTNLSVEDPIIQLQTGPNGAAPTSNSGKDVGTALNYYDTSAKIAWMGWDVSNAEIAFGSNVGIASEVVTFTSLANIRSGNAQLGNLVTANFFSGTLTTASQPNITSLGTLGSLNATGNITGGNLLGPHANGNSNVNIPAANGNVNISAAGNANILVVTGTGVNVAGTANITGNVTAPYFIGNGAFLTGVDTSPANISNGNSNVNIPAANGNINMSAAGNSNIVVITGTGANINGTLRVTGISNLGPNGNVVITGGTNGQVLTTNGSGGLRWANVDLAGAVSNGNSNVSIPTANSNVTVSVAGNANILVITGTGANIDGTLRVTGVSNLGPNGNVIITGGSNGQVLTTDGSGGLSWTTVSGGGSGSNISNGNSNVNIATANGNITMSAAGNANIVTVTGTGIVISGTSNLGAVGNVTITGGSNGQVLTTNGSGGLSWTTVSGGGGGGLPIANGNSEINIPSANGNITVSVGGVSNTVVFANTNVNTSVQIVSTVTTGTAPFSVTSTTLVDNLNADLVDGFNASSAGTINTVAVRDGNADITGNSFIGNLKNGNSNIVITANGNISVSSTGNANVVVITGAGINVAGTANFTGNTSAANANFTGNITGTNANFTGSVSATTITTGAGSGGNITNANIITANLFSGINITVSSVVGPASTGNANASTLTGNLGLRALAGTYTDNSATASSTIATTAVHGIGTLTLAAANSNVTASNAATFFIQGAPIAGSNVTITNGYSLFVAAGNSYFGGNVSIESNLFVPNITIGFLSNGNSNISIPAANGNINFSVGGQANEVVITSTGINVAGTGNFTGNVAVLNLSVTGNATVTGNVSNTRIITRVANNGATTSGNITPTADTVDQYNIIGLSGTANIQIPSGTATDGQKLTIRIKDDGTSRTLNWVAAGSNSYRQIGTTLPASTTANKVCYVGCVYNSQDSYWDVIGVTTEL